MEKDFNAHEKKLLTAASKLEIYASELSYWQKKLNNAELGKESEIRTKMEFFREIGLPIYKEALTLAHELYSNWPDAKQIRGARQLQVAMSNAGVWDYNQGGIAYTIESIQKEEPLLDIGDGNIKIFPYGLRELVRENRNSDSTDSYWEMIKGSYVISSGGCSGELGCWGGLLAFLKEDGRGEFERIWWHELFGKSLVANCKPIHDISEYEKMGVLHWRDAFMREGMKESRREPKVFTRHIIDKLVGGKVFFRPIKNGGEIIESIPNEFDQYKPVFVELVPYGPSKVVGIPGPEKVQVLNPFTKIDAGNTKHLLDGLESITSCCKYEPI